jgi:plasmid stabilization system protein ParE
LKSVVLSPLAIRDLEETVDFYLDRQGPDLAMRYLAALRKSSSLLAANPHLGSGRKYRVTKLEGVRWLALTSPFQKHLIFYRVELEAIDVVRLLHASRNIEEILEGDS